jgi:Cupin-like domain
MRLGMLRLLRAALVPRVWVGTWYASCAGISPQTIAQVSAEGLASDVLYRPFLCANTPLHPYVSRIPKANEIRRFDNLSCTDFDARWVDKPFILTKPVTEWPVFKSWSTKYLLEKYGDVLFRAEAVDWPLSKYIDYMEHNTDESPLYLFDRSFAEKMDIVAGEEGDYWAPTCFGEDLFALLGDQRPDHRWLIIGPERSGSTFHKDPNATSAWNAVIQGSKYWIMFPSGPDLTPPPGVFVSADQSEVTSPLSIAEWLLNFHKEARAMPGCREGICRAGEVLHVPSGWWHLVVNIEPSIAITQNFVPDAHLTEVLLFLRDKPDQVSGFGLFVGDPFSQLTNALEGKDPKRAKRAIEEIERKPAHRKRKWDELVHGEERNGSSRDSEGCGFSFGFTEE